VPVVTLDAYVRNNKLRPPNVIKIDVEGAESAVLRGAAELLTRHRPHIVLSGHGTSQQQACAALLGDFGYDLVVDRDGSEDGIYESVALPRSAHNRRRTNGKQHDGN
jgi:hypothetical protein